MNISSHLAPHSFRYYYQQLSPTEQRAYDMIVAAVCGFTSETDCRGCTPERLLEICECVRRDIPELFYIKRFSVYYTTLESTDCTVEAEFRFSLAECLQMLEAMERKYRPLLRRLRGTAEDEREQLLHDALVRSVRYRDADASYSHESAGPLLYGIGVCDGISKAFKYLADRAGLDCMLVYGSSSYGSGDCGHAWNMVRINGRFYHLDVTFDNTLTTDTIRYDYFNLSDRENSVDHFWEDRLIPCPTGYEYYRRRGLLFSAFSQLRRYLSAEYGRGRTLVFQLPRFDVQQNCSDRIAAAIDECIRSECVGVTSYSLSHNDERMVYTVEFGIQA